MIGYTIHIFNCEFSEPAKWNTLLTASTRLSFFVLMGYSDLFHSSSQNCLYFLRLLNSFSVCFSYDANHETGRMELAFLYGPYTSVFWPTYRRIHVCGYLNILLITIDVSAHVKFHFRSSPLVKGLKLHAGVDTRSAFSKFPFQDLSKFSHKL